MTQTFQSLVDFPQVFLGVSKRVWSGCIPGQSCWLLPSAVVGYLQLCHHLHCAKTPIPRLAGNQVGDLFRNWLGLRSARLAAFCFGWAETLSLGANPCQWLWPPALSPLMCWWLRSWLQVLKGTTTLLSHVIRSPQDCLGLRELELNECEQHVLVAKLAGEGPPISHHVLLTFIPYCWICLLMTNLINSLFSIW